MRGSEISRAKIDRLPKVVNVFRDAVYPHSTVTHHPVNWQNFPALEPSEGANTPTFLQVLVVTVGNNGC